MDAAIAVAFGLLGAAVGSFLNVVIDRVPDRRSLVSPPSHCDSCGRRLSPRDLVPLVSFVLLRRRCRSCGALIPWRVFWVELITAGLFVFLFWHNFIASDAGTWGEFAFTLIYSCVFLVIVFIDLAHHLILNRIVYPAALLALLLNIFRAEPGFLMGLAGGGVGFGLLLLPALVFRGGMGWGDVKMAALIGLVVGFPNVFVAILGAIIAGGLVAAGLMAARTRGRKDAIAFGPFLSVAAVVTMLYGDEIMDWYLGIFALT
jgi:leader peptidase (prepilin peptidase)/N-methyltransferase